ncbi:L1 [Tadarida brasiliensis papillomavirus 2]|nr:L1 [Tadarida brasiliensis papillomavirus 2]
MAVWLPQQNRFYLPPQPVTRIVNTDEYVQRTDTFYYASTERLLTVGHPFYSIKDADGNNVVVPKVSPNQYRVFRVQFADPNNFVFGCDRKLFDPERERLVWAVRGVQIDRGQPLGAGVSGNPLFNRLLDAENALFQAYQKNDQRDTRENIAFDPKQIQLLIVGCKPASGEYWDATPFCTKTPDGQDIPAPPTDACPAVDLKSTIIEDGDMSEIGLGAMNFKTLQANKADAPLDINNEICKYADFIKMTDSPYGDECFFYARREAMYARHIYARGGDMGTEKPPADSYIESGDADDDRKEITANYTATPSGSLISTESQLMNRPYWMQRAQGQNNGIAWLNQLFVTVVDNSRGTSLAINVKSTTASDDNNYQNTDYKEYTRHAEEYQIGFILQLCKVPLNPETLAYIHTMDPLILERWNLAVNAPLGTIVNNHYRYLENQATKCIDDGKKDDDDKDPYKNLKFWNIDLRNRMTEQLDQTPLGRRFLYQTGMQVRNRGKFVSASAPTVSLKRRSTATTSRTTKKRRK